MMSHCHSLAYYAQVIEPLIDNETITVNSSTPVNVTCRMSGPILPIVTVQWLYNDDEVVISPPRITSITSMDTVVLQIRNISSSDVGVYQCVFSNKNLWTLRRSFTIDIVFGKRILSMSIL